MVAHCLHIAQQVQPLISVKGINARTPVRGPGPADPGQAQLGWAGPGWLGRKVIWLANSEQFLQQKRFENGAGSIYEDVCCNSANEQPDENLMFSALQS